MVPFLEKKITWHEAWNEFWKKYKRYNGQQLFSIFGRLPPVTNLKENDIDEGENAWRVYGEFLRLYHSHLAAEIANSGFPGYNSLSIFNEI